MVQVIGRDGRTDGCRRTSGHQVGERQPPVSRADDSAGWSVVSEDLVDRRGRVGIRHDEAHVCELDAPAELVRCEARVQRDLDEARLQERELEYDVLEVVLGDIRNSITGCQPETHEGVRQPVGVLGEGGDGELAPATGLFDRDVASRPALDLSHELYDGLCDRRGRVGHGQSCPKPIGIVASDNPPSTTMVWPLIAALAGDTR